MLRKNLHDGVEVFISSLVDTIEISLSIRNFINTTPSVNDLIKNLKEKNFSEVRKWVVSNLDNDASVLFRRIYDALVVSLENNSIPAAVLVLAKYQYQVAFVVDQEINFLAALTEIMVECEFK